MKNKKLIALSAALILSVGCAIPAFASESGRVSPQGLGNWNVNLPSYRNAIHFVNGTKGSVNPKTIAVSVTGGTNSVWIQCHLNDVNGSVVASGTVYHTEGLKEFLLTGAGQGSTLSLYGGNNNVVTSIVSAKGQYDFH